MKKIIKKFWGVAFLLVLLSTLLVGAVPQAAAMNYMWFDSFATPGSMPTDITLAPIDSFGITAIAQSGATIVVAGTDNNTQTARFYRSTDGGVNWSRIVPTVGPNVAANYTAIAIAPDNANIIAVVGTEAADLNQNPRVVWLTKNGGVNWAQLGAINANAWINDIAIAPSVSGMHNVTVGGNIAACSGANNTGTQNLAYLVTYQLDAIAPAWTAPVGWAVGGLLGLTDDVMALTYSPNYLADYALLVNTVDLCESANSLPGLVALHCYSYNTNMWDAGVEASFPRIIESNPTITTANISNVTKAQLTLDPNFFLGDEALQIGFIGTTITNNVTGNIGGVYRLDYASVGAANVLYQIFTGAVNSVAWDGTNLMSADLNTAASMGPLVVRRSANALTGVPTFSPNSIYKAPGAGYNTQLLFNATSGLAFAVSYGNGAAIAKSTNYGKSWNGYKLVNSHFGDLMDWWISPSGSVIYALTTDNTDMNLWKGSLGFGYSWERVFMLTHVASTAILTDPAYVVRADKDNPDNVYLGLVGGKTMYKSTDGGASWTPRSCSQNIQDFAVQDANTVYVGCAGAGTVVKTTSGALSWTDPPLTVLPAAGGTCWYLNLLSDNNILLSGTAGGVAYTTDGAAWTYLGATFVPIPSIVDATGLAAGDTIFAANGAMLGTWVIGTSFMFGFNFAAPTSGMVYANGVLYTYDTAGNDLRRWLYPTSTSIGAGVAAATDVRGNPGASYNNVGKAITNPLKATTGASFTSGSTSTNLWARSANDNKDTRDTLVQYTEFLTSAADAPTPTYPISDALIPVNSINGAVAPFNFTWNAPKSIADTTTLINYNYNIVVYLDEAGTNLVAGSPTIAQLAANTTATQLSLASPGGFAPGTTYYWRVRVDANGPLESYWSSMVTFTVQQLVAIVPVIASPVNGGSVESVTPGFSWSPIANATSYRFELAKDADFTDIVYTIDPATAGAAVPTDKKLTRGAQYFWHVKTLTPLEGEWSATANFIVAELPTEQAPPVVITTAPTPTYTVSVSIPPATTTIIPPAVIEEKVVNPSYIWAIIIVGAVLVIAVIILIVRTRRTV